ncbi:MAG: contractile injection system protein, VgrG/Pvc8 family, partial [Marinobacter sp.]|uniref:contractile injection system protein, VgrG/Pvc8 family n=1 Tax=Marinobacter sp. TaxID=50741 RepID=UPI00299F288B
MPEANLPTAKGLQFTARVGQLPADLFVVVGFEFTEALSQLFKGELKLASTDPGIGVGEVLEQPVELAIWQDGQLLRRFTGVVSEFARGDTGHRRSRYELGVVPALWRLGLMHYSRIFPPQTPAAILKTLLDER